ncbi:hypothetical protein [Microbacterium sp. G2-8]|uniref:hypothetical protein n=1 Tax=Microbacterium sp. G2-8 TaxID=2842454 RepID=UPI001C88F0E4|nr:hypothetical protein [Microbacterium sp. G2-8]
MADPTYGIEHQKRREELLPAAYGTPCPRCGDVMLASDDLDLGHTIDHALDSHAVGDRIEHASCNRSAGAKLKSTLERYKPSRIW